MTFLESLGRILLNAVFSSLFGIGIGIFTGWATKSAEDVKGMALHETCMVVLFTYLSYVIAEFFNVSGIISLMICGIMLAQYAYWNLSLPAR
eukprot:CAMPEP_0201285608 /NCGR_PEP_ID=MMETSP1317-20130820/113573_1 /ASSEMBLY_ACC=CAM_ASM_000770 /TAXON_ID=187299 /ORGANISM="Undescribed Undescribed, Strain Undescribed" /LENGTH=91 /DNA_ID=CAMNT_0047611233 /DNA_START=202 /DNA_END=477 /DNA_ORIENTATION=-